MSKIFLVLFFVSVAAAGHAQKIRIVGNSPIAKIAGRIKGEDTYAVTIGRTIFLSCKKKDFFAEEWWMRHEFTHVQQYEKYGTLPFLSLYLYYAIFRHKKQNPFEREAEAAEFSNDSPVAVHNSSSSSGTGQ